jgi:hypothetical protein
MQTDMVDMARQLIPDAPAGVSRSAPFAEGTRPGNIDGMGLLLGRDKTLPAGNRRQNPRSHTLGRCSPDSEVYGDTSGITFHQLLLDTLVPAYSSLSGVEDPSGNPPTAQYSIERDLSGFLGLSPLDDGLHLRPDNLPTISEAEVMWNFYVQNTHQLYPFIDMTWVQQSYEHLLSPHRSTARSERRDHSSLVGPADPLRVPINQPVITLHLLIFALVQALSETTMTQRDGTRLQSLLFS